MTLAGLALAIGPLVDSAIICLENTHRHLGLGARPRKPPFWGERSGHARTGGQLLHAAGARAVGLHAGMGKFLFRPMFLAVAFAMTIAYILSRTFVPSRCATG